MTPDLVIVGGGTAGLAAAVRATERGLHAVVLEKTADLGGQLHWSFGQFSAAGTRRQAARGIVDHPDAHAADVHRIGHGLADPALVRLAVDQLAPTVDWLEDLGFPFDDACPALVHGHEVYGTPRTYWGAGPRTEGGLALLRTLVPRVGPPVEVRLGHRFTGFVTDADGRVTGVRATGPEGPTTVHATTTLLTTGGYAADRALVAELQPRWAGALTGCRDHATGDGHRAVRDAFGTAIVGGAHYIPTMGMIEDPDRPGTGFRLADQRLIVDASARPPHELWVNTHGARFVAEDTSSPHQREARLLAQPGAALVAVWDARAVADGPPVIGPDWTRAGELAEAARGRWLHRADDLGDLARRVGVDAAGLADTVAAYNRDLARGRPDPLGRHHRPGPIDRPPFYAVRTVAGMLLSRGGPQVDQQLRPVRDDGRPVDGLHLAGEVLGMSQFSGDAFAGGMSIGPALALARHVVDRVAASVASP